jgi:dTDP-4-amino-4,6-dideoxygalactose transaminase
MKIPFNKIYTSGNEIEYIKQVLNSDMLTGEGYFTKKCQELLENKYGFKKVILTTTCTDALEMTSILANIQPGDDVIIPSYTFVSTANAFLLRNANIIFADSEANTPNIDADKIENLITAKTKAIVVVHYSGIACDMDKILSIVKKNNLMVIEDAAHSIDSYYNGKPLGSIGNLATMSFHETKNITSGEGGVLIVNDESLIERVEIIRDKGTNRAKFLRGEVDKYEWVDIGSSYSASEVTAAILYSQLEQLDKIQKRRVEIWEYYFKLLTKLQDEEKIELPFLKDYASNNGHIFYLVCKDKTERETLIRYLKEKGISAVFHYLSLHKSPLNKIKGIQSNLPNSDKYSDCLVRLPIYYELKNEEIEYICKTIFEFFKMN